MSRHSGIGIGVRADSEIHTGRKNKTGSWYLSQTLKICFNLGFGDRHEGHMPNTLKTFSKFC